MAWRKYFTHTYLSEILRTSYGIKSPKLDILPGYEDFNMKVQAEDDVEGADPNAKRTMVLKITKMKNPEEEPRYVLQDMMALYLRNNGTRVSVPVQTMTGQFHTLCSSSPSVLDFIQLWTEMVHTCYIRALEYIPGVSLSDAGIPEELVYEASQLLGRMDILLKDFEPDVPVVIDMSLELSRFPKLKSRVHLYCHDDTTTLAYEILDMFDVKIKPQLTTFQKGYIHGDVRCDNIIVEQTENMDGNRKYRFNGFIDFGDVCFSYYLFEISVFMADLISLFLGTDHQFHSTRLALKGFREEFELSPHELSCLRLCICVRLMGVYIFCCENSREDPTNEAITVHIQRSLAACKFLWNMNDKDFYKQVIV